ncbi:hypothetical protein KEM55_002441 [Ascosphaera atra]|nr:hypothetical protein KEM55_002441 [Ascosphaera atra]
MKGVMDELKAKEREAEEERMKSLVEQVGSKVEEMKDGMAKDSIDAEAVSGIKAGLEGLRDELAQFTKRFEGFDGARQESSIGKDIEELKSALGGLQDQLQKTIPATAPEAAKKEELGPVMEALKSVQGFLQAPETVKKAHVDELLQAVNGVQENLKIPENVATREDVDSLETLLHAMKTRMDELMAPEGTMHGLTVERFNSLAAVTNETKKMIETMQAQAQAQVKPSGDDSEIEKSFVQDEEAEDINGIIKDIWIMVEDLKTGAERAEKNQQDPETRVTKEEVQSLEGLTFDIKALVEGLKIPDPKTLPTKSDLNTFVASFNEFREKVSSEADLTAQAFESRKIEHGGLATKIDEAKDLVGESRFELRERMITGQERLADVKKTIDAMVKGAEKLASAEAVAGLRELVAREFEKASAVDAEASKAAGERNEAQLRKLDETREKIFSDLVANLDVRFAEITARHVEHQNYLEGKFDASRKRDVQHVEALTEARAVIENLMGIVRGQGDVLKQTTSGISENADSFYERADKAFTGLGDSMKSQQELVQAEFAKASEATGRLEKQLGDSQPEIIDTLKGLLATVGAEFAAAKSTQGEVAQNVKELPETLPKLVVDALPPPPKIELPEPYDDTAVRTKLDSLIGTVRSMPKPEKYDDTCVVAKLESIISHIKSLPEPENYDDTEVNDKLDQVLDYLTSMSELGTKYDDAPVQGKLDTLLDQATVTGEILLQMDKLDKIQEQVSATQRELTELKTAQAAQIAAEHSSKRKEAEEMAVLLERRKAQKEKIESEILSLHDEKDALLTSVRALRDEKDDLWKTNSKLGRELSGIETALQIRREEMRLMEQRADALERKIVEGSLDHARSLMLATGSNVSRRKSAQSKDGSNAPVSNTVAMALKRRGPAKAGVAANGKEKRILSLNNAGILANRGNERDMSVMGGDVHDVGNKATKSMMLPVSARNFSLDSKSAILSAIQAKANKEASPLSKENKHLPVHEEDEESQLASQEFETPSRTPPVIIKSPEETPRQQQRVSVGKDEMMDVPTVPVNVNGNDQYAQDATGYETQSNADTEKHDTSYDSSSTYVVAKSRQKFWR